MVSWSVGRIVRPVRKFRRAGRLSNTESEGVADQGNRLLMEQAVTGRQLAKRNLRTIEVGAITHALHPFRPLRSAARHGVPTRGRCRKVHELSQADGE